MAALFGGAASTLSALPLSTAGARAPTTTSPASESASDDVNALIAHAAQDLDELGKRRR
jgi:hypothetical protein